MKIIDDPLLREKIRVFRDRIDAGVRLAEKLQEYRDRRDTVVLAIPCGGVPIGLTISRKLNLEFNLIMVRKIHFPWNPEAGFGAVGWDKTYLLNYELIKLTGLSPKIVAECISRELEEIKLRMKEWRLGEYYLNVKDKTVIITDDGLASGYTMSLAVEIVRNRGCKKVVIAVPTASIEALKLVSKKIDEAICLNIRSSKIFAVADAYIEWRDISNDEVRRLLLEYESMRNK